MQRRRHGVATTSAILTLLFLGACSSGETANSDSTSAPTVPPTGATPIAGDDGAAILNPCTGEGPVGVPVELGRTDVTRSGNRVAPGSIDLANAPRTEIDLPARPQWVVRHPGPDGPCLPSWYVTLDDGTAVIVDSAGDVADAGPAVVPPETDASADPFSTHQRQLFFDDPLPDTRVVNLGSWTAALVDPTDRYGHGVLGDAIEAGAVGIFDTSAGERRRIVIEPPAVIEGISPLLVDVDGDGGQPEVLVTVSDSTTGARLVLYDVDGTIRAQSEPIGRGNRWRNQLGVAPVGPDGQLEVVDVRTPHLDGVVEFFAIAGDRLELVASTSGYTTHVIGSRNLDLGLIVDADADARPEVVVPSRDLGALAVLKRTGDGVAELARIDLDGRLATNVATQWINGQAWLAAGTDDGRLLVFGDPGR